MFASLDLTPETLEGPGLSRSGPTAPTFQWIGPSRREVTRELILERLRLFCPESGPRPRDPTYYRELLSRRERPGLLRLVA